MRFIHTADWHLGKTFYNNSLIEDQAYVLQQVVQLARETKPDVVLIAGDIYDRAIPPIEAVELLDDVLYSLVQDIEVAVILIAGNHDSPQRLQFGARLLESIRLHVFGKPNDQAKFLQFYDNSGVVCFYAMPYAEPAVLRQYWKNPQITNHEEAYRAYVNMVQGNMPKGARTVFVGHCFVTGGNTSESERPLSVGGSDQVSSECFTSFNYAALGHLHRPQTVVTDAIQYSGSLLKYSFSEAEHHKSVNLVEMNGLGHCAVEHIPLTPKRDVKCIEGYLDALLGATPDSQAATDFVRVQLLDQGALLDAMGRLRQVYPNVVELTRPRWMPDPTAPTPKPESGGRDVLALFSEFFRQVTGDDLAIEECAVFSEVVERLAREDREVRE